MSSTVSIYSHGLVYASACVIKGIPVAAIEREVNAQLPTGIQSTWKIAQERFSTGEPNPHPCEASSSRLHYLLNC